MNEWHSGLRTLPKPGEFVAVFDDKDGIIILKVHKVGPTHITLETKDKKLWCYPLAEFRQRAEIAYEVKDI